MKRKDLRPGTVVGVSSDRDWREYGGITQATVVDADSYRRDTSGFFRSHCETVTVGDATHVLSRVWADRKNPNLVVVQYKSGRVDAVPYAHARGLWDWCLAENKKAMAARDAKLTADRVKVEALCARFDAAVEVIGCDARRDGETVVITLAEFEALAARMGGAQ